MSVVRRSLLALFVFGATGTGIELLLLAHYDGFWQLVPLGLIAIALIVIAWHLAQRDRASLRALETTMAAFVLAGCVGTFLHYEGAAEFQLEIDRTQHGWPLLKKVMTAKAPPVLAPGVMLQLGFLGLIYALRHPDDTAVHSPQE